MLTLHLARVVVYGCCPLGFDKLVSCLLLAGLRNLLLCLLSAEEVRVRLTPHWGRGWVASIFLAGGVAGFFMVTSLWGMVTS